MPAVTIPTPLIATDPGVLFWAPLGTAEPTNTVAGSIFTDAWPSGWIVLGATDSGSDFSYQLSTDQVQAAEFLDPIKYVTTGRVGSIGFALLSITANNVKRALNGGTLTTTGTTGTTMTTYTPPVPGQEVRCMIGWESLDSTERLLGYQCLSSGNVQLSRNKGAARASLPFTANFEIPTTGIPFKYSTAGVARLGT